MSFAREKRLLLGILALLAPLPLPFNQVLEWPVFFVFTALLIYFLHRVERGIETCLPNWLLNVLGLIYFPILFVDLQAAFYRGRIVMALLHLILFLVVVKLYSLRREKDKWHLTVAIFFVFIGAMATSSHVAVVLYLIAFLITGLLLLARFAHLHVLAATRDQDVETAIPVRRPLLLGSLLILVLAIPLFAAMPRFRQPFVFGESSGGSGLIRSTGFSDSVDLNLTSTIRGNRDVALRVQFDDERDGDSLRFKAATYAAYRDRQWHRDRASVRLLSPSSSRDQLFRLDGGETAASATVYLEPISSSSLVLPLETLALRLETLPPMLTLGLDAGGAVSLPWSPPRSIRYQVELAEEPVHTAILRDEHGRNLALDETGISERMRQLASEAMAGADDDSARIARLEEYLLTNYEYTLDFVGRDGQNPLEDFLFVYRSGHCEYFASAMVLLLRSQGIPATLVTGFLGAEYNPIEGYFIVRQQNAHAWVEAYSPLHGWRAYDPTPPEGRPAIAEQSLSLLLSQLYDYMTFRWDRYVLTYGAEDQVGLFDRVREQLRAWRESLRRWLDGDEEPAPSPSSPEVVGEPMGEPAIWQPKRPWWIAASALTVLFAAYVWWRRRTPLSAETAYRRLRRRLERAGLEIAESLPPLQLEERARQRFPSTAEALRQVVELYLRESFAGQDLAGDERQRLAPALRAVAAGLRHDARQRSRRKRRRVDPGGGTLASPTGSH